MTTMDHLWPPLQHEKRRDDADGIMVKAWRRKARSTRGPRQAEHEHQHLGDSLVELDRDLVAELDIGERAGQHLVLLDRDVVGLGDLDDLGADRALALGCDARRALAVVMQRDRKLGLGPGLLLDLLLGLLDLAAHSARSRK